MAAALRPWEEGNSHLPDACPECLSPLAACPACGTDRNCVLCNVCVCCGRGRSKSFAPLPPARRSGRPSVYEEDVC